MKPSTMTDTTAMAKKIVTDWFLALWVSRPAWLNRMPDQANVDQLVGLIDSALRALAVRAGTMPSEELVEEATRVMFNIWRKSPCCRDDVRDLEWDQLVAAKDSKHIQDFVDTGRAEARAVLALRGSSPESEWTEIARLREIVTAPLSSEELKLIDKNCDWIAFGHAWNAVMKRRQAAVIALTTPPTPDPGDKPAVPPEQL